MTKFAAVIAATIFLVAGKSSATSASLRDCSDFSKMVQILGGDFLMGGPHSVSQSENAPPKRAKRERPVNTYVSQHLQVENTK